VYLAAAVDSRAKRDSLISIVVCLITLSKGNNAIETVAKCKREMAPKEEVLM